MVRLGRCITFRSCRLGTLITVRFRCLRIWGGVDGTWRLDRMFITGLRNMVTMRRKVFLLLVEMMTLGGIGRLLVKICLRRRMISRAMSLVRLDLRYTTMVDVGKVRDFGLMVVSRW